MYRTLFVLLCVVLLSALGTPALAHGTSTGGAWKYWMQNASNWNKHHCNRHDQSGCIAKQ